jgi:hypothetical protein
MISAANADYEHIAESSKSSLCQEFEIKSLTRVQPHKRVNNRTSGCLYKILNWSLICNDRESW